jgi:hypothetical protein
VKRPISITVVAWLLIVTFGLGAMFNIYGFAASIPPYPRWVWAALFVVKCGGLLAGVLLLRMRRLAVWIYVAAVIVGWVLSLGVTNNYTPIALWRYATGLLVVGIYAFFVFRHWDKLLPNKGTTGVRTDA